MWDDALYLKSEITQMQKIKTKQKNTVYSTPADNVSFHLKQKDPRGKTEMPLGLMYNYELTSAWPLLIAKRLFAADFMQNVKTGLNAEPGSLEEGVDFKPLHHWADTVLTPAGWIKAQGKRVISLWICMCVCLYYHALGGFHNREMDINGFTDMEKVFKLKRTPGPCFAEGWCCVLLVLPSGRLVVQLHVFCLYWALYLLFLLSLHKMKT